MLVNKLRCWIASAVMSEPLQYLSVAGDPVREIPLSVKDLLLLYGNMVAGRTYDRKCIALQLQGRLATYAPFEGQEAAQIGSVFPLTADDWVVASYRDAAAMWATGYPWVNLILSRTGDERGGCPPDGVRVLPPSITVGGHMIHAVGLGWAEKIKGSKSVAMTFFGDGATSEGDFHEAMNFAGVYGTPTVFVCQNNEWAISMPRDRQTASDTIAQKAAAYGMPGIQVDGNDVVAVAIAAAEAVDRAREGQGPTLLELLTYRVGPHTTTDDPGRYRDEEASHQWRRRDPLSRLSAYLASIGEWDEKWAESVAADTGADVERAVAEAEALEPLTSEEIFTAMFAEPTSQLLEQQRLAVTDNG